MLDLVTLEGWADGLLRWFAETSLVASALAVAACLASRLRRLAPGPAARHALWLIVLVRLVAPPVAHWPWALRPLPSSHGPGWAGPADRVGAVAASPGSGPVLLGSDSTSGMATRDRGVVIADGLGRGRGDDASQVAPAAWLAAAWLAAAWLVGSLAVAAVQARRVGRFLGLLRGTGPPPSWLVEQAERVGLRLGVRVPEIRVAPRLGTPLLWCLGRPVLLIPCGLLETLEADRWRAVLAHELAHLRRGDHWVRRLELVAGLAWWWNPLYWLALRRVDHEAELACDAWVFWATPEDRLSYAESLIRIGSTLSSAATPAPALGVAGTGRSFERRLTMILRDRVDHRVTAPSLASAFLLAFASLPSWTQAGQDPAAEPRAALAPFASQDREPRDVLVEVAIAQDDDDDDDDDDAPRPKEAERAKARMKAKIKALAKEEVQLEELREKKVVAEKARKEMEDKFGPGSEFAKKMEALNEEMEKKFGPDSEFAKRMEAMGKEMEKKFGPGSEFAREMETFAKARGEAAIRGQKDAWKAQERGEDEARRARDQGNRARDEARKFKEAERPKGGKPPEARARRIEAIEAQINALKKELERLKARPEEGDKDVEF